MASFLRKFLDSRGCFSQPFLSKKSHSALDPSHWYPAWDVQKFLDGTALTDVLLEYDNARDKEIENIRRTTQNATVSEAMITKAQQDNPYRLWQAIEQTLGSKKVTDIKVLKNQIDFGIVDHTNHHGISKGYTAEAYIRAWEQKLGQVQT